METGKNVSSGKILFTSEEVFGGKIIDIFRQCPLVQRLQAEIYANMSEIACLSKKISGMAPQIPFSYVTHDIVFFLIG